MYLERLVRSYFPRKIYLIQDNASYHKDGEVWDCFSGHRKNIEVYNLPTYSPELNAQQFSVKINRMGDLASEG